MKGNGCVHTRKKKQKREMESRRKRQKQEVGGTKSKSKQKFSFVAESMISEQDRMYKEGKTGGIP